jgi:hypothetical protein
VAVQRALVSIPSTWRVEVWLGATLAELRRRTDLPGAFFAEVANGVLLRIEVDDLERIARELAGLGVPLVIRQPPELRAALHRYALALARDALCTDASRATQEE